MRDYCLNYNRMRGISCEKISRNRVRKFRGKFLLHSLRFDVPSRYVIYRRLFKSPGMTDVVFISCEIARSTTTSSRKTVKCFVRNKGCPRVRYFNVVNSFKSEHRKYITFDVRAFLVARHDTSHAAAPRVDTHRVG